MDGVYWPEDEDECHEEANNNGDNGQEPMAELSLRENSVIVRPCEAVNNQNLNDALVCQEGVYGEYTTHNPEECIDTRNNTFATSHLSKTKPLLMHQFSDNNILHQSLIKQQDEPENWNRLFQAAVDDSDGDDPEKWIALASLGRDFVYTSKKYGKIIINELTLPIEEKTIKPVDAGGVAGGMKYIASGIFFKFALDTKQQGNAYVYGYRNNPNHSAAIKAASNEMLGLLGYYNSGVKGLHYPLLCIIDYRGFRLLAMSILPIDKDKTLIYGSRDASKHVVNNDEKFSALMKEVGKQLNLKKHSVQSMEPPKNVVELYAPVDIEGHRGTDGKYYVLDFGRVFPPEYPPAEAKSSEIFYNLLRPEFVRSYCTPLSSDAKSTFGKIDSNIHNPELEQATKHLHDVVIPSFAKENLLPLGLNKLNHLTQRLHRAGINCRHLGIIRSLIDQEDLRRSVLSEIVARILKSVLRTVQLNFTLSQIGNIVRQEPYNRIAFQLIKSFLGPIAEPLTGITLHNALLTEKTSLNKVTEYNFAQQNFWRVGIKYVIQKYFKKTFSKEELKNGRDIRENIQVRQTAERFCELSAIKLRGNLLHEYESDPADFRLVSFDLRKQRARVRHLNVIDEVEGKILFHEAQTIQNPYSGIWEATHDRFQRAIVSNSNNAATLLQWGNVYYRQSFLFSKTYSETASTTDKVTQRSLIFRTLHYALEKCLYAREIRDSSDSKILHAFILLEFGVVDFVYVTANVPRMANTQWKIDSASSILREIFQQDPTVYEHVIKQAEAMYDAGLESSSKNQALFYFLRAYIIQHAAIDALGCIPRPGDMYRCTEFLFEYLKRGGRDIGHQLAGSAGTMLESALLENPILSDGEVVYSLDKSPLYSSPEQFKVTRPVHVYDRLSPDHYYHLRKTVSLLPTPSLLHFIPVSPKEPSRHEETPTNQLLHMLGNFATSTTVTSYRFTTTSNTFYLRNTVCHRFLVMRMEFGISESLTLDSLPQQIVLTGLTNLMDGEECFQIEIEPHVGYNSILMHNSAPSKYLKLQFECKTDFAMQYLSFYGIQVNADVPHFELPRLPAVKWVNHPSSQVVVSGPLASIARNRVPLPPLHFNKEKKISIRASPAFTISTGEVDRYLYIINSSGDELIESEIRSSCESSEIVFADIESFHSSEELRDYLQTWDPTEFCESVNEGAFRVCVIDEGSSDVSLESIRETLCQSGEWLKKVPIFQYNERVAATSSMGERLWISSSKEDIVEFSSASSPVKPKAKTILEHTPKKSKRYQTKKRLKKLERVLAHKRLSGEALDLETHQVRGHWFLYFEVTFECSGTLSVGLSQEDFPVNEFCGHISESFGFFNSGQLYCGNGINSYKFKDLVRNTTYGAGDTIGCGYNRMTNEIYWTKNGYYLGTAAENCSVYKSLEKPLFPTVSVSNYDGTIVANFGNNLEAHPFQFNVQYFEKITEESHQVLSARQCSLTPLGDILKKEYFNYYLPILSNIAQFASSFRTIMRAYMEISNDFLVVHFPPYVKSSEPKMILKDSTLVGICEILPRSNYALNLDFCSDLSETFIDKLPNADRMRMLSLSKVETQTELSASLLAKHCKLLSTLRVWENITDAGLSHVILLEKLESLDLTKCQQITCIGFCAVIKKLKLKSLVIDECTHMTNNCLEAIANSQSNSLEKFSMERNNFSEDAVIHLIKTCTKLISLGAGGWSKCTSVVNDNVMKVICDKLHGQLHGLNIYRAAITEDSFKKLICCCTQLQNLNVGRLSIHEKYLANLANLPILRHLDLVASAITDDTLLALVRGVELNELSVQNCRNLSSRGIIEAFNHLKRCTTLCLRQTNCDDSVSDELQILKELKWIDIGETFMSRTVIQKIHPHLTIIDSTTTELIDESVHKMWELPNSYVVKMHKRKHSH